MSDTTRVSGVLRVESGIGLTTAVVKAELSPDGSRYDSVVISSCISIVNELIVATRSPVIADAKVSVPAGYKHRTIRNGTARIETYHPTTNIGYVARLTTQDVTKPLFEPLRYLWASPSAASPQLET